MDTTSLESRDRLRQAIVNEINSWEAHVRGLKSRQNELAPISRLPCEVLATIFSFLPIISWNEGSDVLTWIYVAHVCRRWRETALSYPRFGSYINITNLTSIGLIEIVLSRAKMAPLHLKADSIGWCARYLEVFERQLEAHISHIRHLEYKFNDLSRVGMRLVSPTPTLEFLSLSYGKSSQPRLTYAIPENLFDGTAPNLTRLELEKCEISWKSPLLKSLRSLKILYFSVTEKPKLDDWLDALNEMPKLEELSLQSAAPPGIAPIGNPLISRTVTLPSLTHFHIDDFPGDCALALAHLVLPSLTSLHVHVQPYDRGGEDVLLVIPYVVQHVYVLQDIEPIRSILIACERGCTEVVTWAEPGADVKVCGPDTLVDMASSACFLFSAKAHEWRRGMETAVFDALLTLLSVNSVSTLTAHNCTRLSKEFWLKHASRLPLLEQARLVPTAVEAFKEMLVKDIPLDSDGPRLPMLTKLILVDVGLDARRTCYLGDMLIERVEQGVPLECLDLRTCVASNGAIQLLAEIVVDVQEPPNKLPMTRELIDFSDCRGHYNEISFDRWQNPWYNWYDGYEDEYDA